MNISDEDADEILIALSDKGFEFPYVVRVASMGKDVSSVDKKAWADSRRALIEALEGTEAWSRYRIY